MKLDLQAIYGQGLITALATVRDGKFLIAAALDSLLVFGAGGLKLRRTAHSVHSDLVTALAAEPGGAPPPHLPGPLLASASLDGQIKVWSVSRAGELVLSCGLHLGSPIHDIGWAAGAEEPGNAGAIAAALEDGRVALWRIEADSAIFLGEKGVPARSVSWFPDGLHLASSGEDGILRIWELPSGAEAEGGLLHHYNPIQKVRVSSCGRYIAFLGGDEKGALFDLDTRESHTFGEPGDPVVSLAWHPRLPALIGGTERGRSFCYDVPDRRLALGDESKKHIHPAEAAAWRLPDGGIGWTGGRDGRILAWSRSGRDPWQMKGQHSASTQGYGLAVAWEPDASRLAASYSDGNVALWSLDEPDAKPRFLEKPHSKPVYGLAVSPDGRSVASGSVDKTIKVWDLKETLQVFDLQEIHTKPVYGVSFSPDGRYLATGSGDTYLVVYDIEAKKKQAQEAFGQDEFLHFAVRERILNCVAWSPDGGRIAVGLSNHSVVVLEAGRDGKVSKGPALKLHEDSVSSVAWGPEGKFLVSVGYDRRIVVWDGSTYRPRVERVCEHEQPIQALAVHPGGAVIATGSWDRTIRVWDVEGLVPLAVAARPHYSAVEGLDFSRDGKLLASASSDGTVGVWAVEL